MLKKNDIIELSVTDVTNDGSGVGRYDGGAVFVPCTAPGDKIKARIVKVLPRYSFGIIEELLSPSTARAEDGCAVFSRCGSCSLRHIAYEQELKIKNGWVQENMRRIGKIDVTLPPALPSPLCDRYRNKAVYPIRRENGKAVSGFFAKRSHRLVKLDDCLLHPKFFSNICRAFCRWLDENNISVYDEQNHTGLVRSLFIRHAEATGEVMVTVIINGKGLPNERTLPQALCAACPNIASVVINVNTEKTNVLLGKSCRTIYGADTITDTLCGLNFSISPLSFYQVNRQGAQRLYGVAAEFAALTGSETLLDLYCGTGTIGLSMARQAKRLIGVEIIPAAIENAKQNAKQNVISNARFICGDAADAAALLKQEGLDPDVVVLDPPRKGCAPALIETVVKMSPQRVVMVSCDSATAARDTAIFDSMGYHPQKIQAVDMFPRTAHIETVVLLSKLSQAER